MTIDDTFQAWLHEWMDLAGQDYTGPEVPDVETRINRLIALWRREIPGDWQRSSDRLVDDSEIRYRRGELAGPKPGSEHELELQVLDLDPSLPQTCCFGERLIDGINAVPLSKDPNGHRRGDVEADMLLLTEGPLGQRLFLVEAKARSDNAWYATVENLRQLRLFTSSRAAREIMTRRNGALVPTDLPIAALVLAPHQFYAAAGAKARAVKPAQKLGDRLASELGLDVRLGVWDRKERSIAALA